MIDGDSIRDCADECEISVSTSFYWRHKILDAIRKFLGVGNVSGVVEIDETYFPESFKGNHKKSTEFVMPRKARKRGKQIKKRGISNEQICVLCAIDRNDNIINELLCKGRMKHDDLIRIFTNRIEKTAIICTDSHKRFIGFAHDFKLEHIQIKRGKHKEGTYHIQHINSYHSRLKGWMSRFNGVATKYLVNYLYWHKWLELFDTEKDPIKGKEFIVHSNSIRIDTKISDFRSRQPVFV